MVSRTWWERTTRLTLDAARWAAKGSPREGIMPTAFVVRTVLSGCCLGSMLLHVPGSRAADARPLPWQEWIEEPIPAQRRDLEHLFDLAWRNSGGKEGRLSVSGTPGPWGGRQFDFEVTIDHHNEGKYPQGWPSFETVPRPARDFSGYDAIRYWLRCDATLDRAVRLRFILWTAGEGRLNTILEPFEPNKWIQVTHRVRDLPHIDKVDRIHFFLCESDYRHGEKLAFHAGGFELCNLQKSLTRLPANSAAAGLWAGQRADSSDEVVILDTGAAELPLLLVVETGAELALKADDELHVRFHEVFSGSTRERSRTLGHDVPAGTVQRLELSSDVSELKPGYHLVVADLRRGGKSLLGGRLGSDDVYIRRADESMTFTVLSVRAGMVQWVRDLLHGDIMCRTRIALPHVYDPLSRDTYPAFIRLFAHTTGKHTEGNEAGDTGLALAAEAFRKAGDLVRCRFTEDVLKDSYDHMINSMQAPNGATITWANELADKGIGKGGPTTAFGAYDSNQVGEWIRALVYGLVYFQRVPEHREYAAKLNAACRKAADYLAQHAVQPSDGLDHVMRHLRLNETPDGTVKQVTYAQEGRQCDVYLGRALSGLSYYAYAMQLRGDDVPADWWQVMDDTVAWAQRKMRPNGWFDWQCEDVVEGGCHTFLGNIYIGEGLFGCYLASRRAGRLEAARRAAEATRKAYRYVTDDCWIKGRRYTYPLEFWVGPYVYWLFTEYLDTIGPDEALQDWLQTLDRRWSVERGWRDFLARAPTGGCGRTTTNGMLEVSILGYLGIKQMAEIGQPLHWPLD